MHYIKHIFFIGLSLALLSACGQNNSDKDFTDKDVQGTGIELPKVLQGTTFTNGDIYAYISVDSEPRQELVIIGNQASATLNNLSAELHNFTIEFVFVYSSNTEQPLTLATASTQLDLSRGQNQLSFQDSDYEYIDYDFDEDTIPNLVELADGTDPFIKDLFLRITSQDSIDYDENETIANAIIATTNVANTTLTYSISETSADLDLFSINSQTGSLAFINSPDYEVSLDDNTDNIYSLEIQVSDNEDRSATQTLSINVQDLNEPPVFTSPAFTTIDEGTQVIEKLIAIDPENAELRYSIEPGKDQSLFSINSVEGVLSFIVPPVYDINNSDNNIYAVDVSVTDGVNTTLQSLAIFINPVSTNIGFTAPANSNIGMPENVRNVATISATSSNNNNAIQYGFVAFNSIDNDLFTIDSSSGLLQFKTAPDYENPMDQGQDNTYQVFVSASDGEEVLGQILLITVADVVEVVETAPDTPINVTAVAGQDSVTINWDAVANTEHYRVYWNTTGNISTGDSYINAGKGTQVVHNNLSSDTIYYYAVLAVNSNGFSDLSQVRSASSGAVDTTPNQFTFIDQTNIDINSLVISNQVTVAGINSASAISINGGEYSIDGGSYISNPSTIDNGQVVTVRLTASNNPDDVVNAILTIGGVSDTFSVTTLPVDTTPDAFSFVSQNNVTVDTQVISNTISLAGINAATAISITGGEYNVDGGAFTGNSATVVNGQQISVRQTSSTSYATSTEAVLTVGTITRSFSVTTSALLTASNLDAAETYIENAPSFTLTPVVVSSPDSVPVTVTYTPTDVLAGNLTITGTGTVSVNSNATTGVWSATGPAADLNTVLNAVSFTPAQSYSQNFSYAVTVSDGVRPDISGSKLFTVTPIAEIIAASSVVINPVSPATAGDNISLTVDVKDASNNPVAVTVGMDVTGSNTQSLSVSNPAAGSYTSNYVATNAGTDDFTVLLNGAQLTTSTYTINEPDLVAPSLLSISPADLDDRVAINQQFILNFDEAIDPASVTAGDFSVNQGSTPVAGVVSTVGNQVIFTADENLQFATAYTASYVGNVADFSSNSLAVNSSWGVTTMSAPEVISIESYVPVSVPLSDQNEAGDIFQVWYEDGSTGSGGVGSQASFYRYYDSATQTWTGPVKIQDSIITFNRIEHNANGFLAFSERGSTLTSYYFDGVTLSSARSTGANAYDYDVVSNGSSFALVWAASSGDIYMKSYSITGNTWGAQIDIEADANLTSSKPLIASDGANYSAIWIEHNTLNNTYNLRASIFDGTNWGVPIDLAVGALSSFSNRYKIAGNNTGYAMVWLANDDVNVNYYNNGSSNISTLNDPINTNFPSVSYLVSTADGFVAAWQQGGQIIANVFKQGAWSGPSVAASSGTIRKVTTGANTYLIAYTDSVTSVVHVYASVYDGTNWVSTGSPLDTSTVSVNTNLSVATDGDRYAVAWAQRDVVDEQYVAIYSGSWAAPVRLDSSTIKHPWNQTPVVYSGSNGFYSTWVEHDGTGFAKYSSRYTFGVGWVADSANLVKPVLRGHATDPKMVINNAGVVVAVWNQQTSEYRGSFYSVKTGANWTVPARLPLCAATFRGLDIVTNGDTFMISCGTYPSSRLVSYLLTGTTLGPDQVIFNSTTTLFSENVLAANGSDYAAVFPTSSNGISVNIFDSTLGAWTGEQVLKTTAGYNGYSHPHISGNGNSFAATWWEPLTSSSNSTLYSSVFNGSAWGNATAVSTTLRAGSSNASSSNIQPFGEGYVLNWISDRNYTSIYDAVADSWTLENPVAGGARYTYTSSNNININTVSSSTSSIYSSVFDSAGNVISTFNPASVNLNNPSVGAPQSASNGTGYGITWNHKFGSNGEDSAYMARYEQNAWTPPLLLENKIETVSQPSIYNSGNKYRAIWSQPDAGALPDEFARRIWVSGEF